MKTFEDALRMFGRPTETFDPALFDLIVSTHANESAARFVEAFQLELDINSAGLSEFLTRAADSGVDAAVAWHPSFAHLYHAVQGVLDAPVVKIAVAAGLRLVAAGLPANWQAHWEAPPIRLRCGPWLLPPATSIEVRSSGSSVHVTTGLAGLSTESRFEASFTGRSSSCEALETIGTQFFNFELLHSASLLPHECRAFDSLIPCTAISSGTRGAFSNALNLIAHGAPAYLPWIGRALRCIAVVEPAADDILSSGTTEWSGGFIHVSSSRNEIALAEALVHEASHQYFHVATRLGPVDDGSDQTAYYSPVVNSLRTLPKILLAYHAFANVILFYRDLIRARIEPQRCAKNAAEVENQLRVLARPLLKNRALTPVGRALFGPVSDLIN